MNLCVLIYVDIDYNNPKHTLDAVLKQDYNQNLPIFVCGNYLLSASDEYSGNKNITWISPMAPYSVSYEAGINNIFDFGYDWVWCVKNGVVPEESALSELVKGQKIAKTAGYFTSLIKKNDQPVFCPAPSSFAMHGEMKWAEFFSDGLARIAYSTMHSVLLSVNAIRELGIPTVAQLANGTGYLAKVSGSYGAGYYVCKSIAHLDDPQPQQKKTVIPYIQQQKNKICAIVVTYNRKNLLLECLSALLRQTYTAFDVLVIDNASTDGTHEAIRSKYPNEVKYYNTGANLGGSGGFYYGMKIAYQQGYEWLWIMDDDVIPSPTALAELVTPTLSVKNASFFASTVFSTKGQAMNSPEISNYSTNGYRFWYSNLDKGLVRLAHATFVSLLINRNAITKCGLPLKDYFIWGDDTEYTMRIIGKYGAAFFVGKSKVVHKRANSSTLSIYKETNPNRIKMYYYMVRNTLLNAKTYFGKASYHNFFKQYVKDCIKIALGKRGYRLLKVKTILRALIDFKRNKYDVYAFNNRYSLYGQENAVVTITNDYTASKTYPFNTIRNLPISFFGYNKYVDYYVLSLLANESGYSCGDPYSQISLLDNKENLVLDIDALIRPFYVLKHADRSYYFDEDTQFKDGIESSDSVSLEKVSFYSMERKTIESRILDYLDGALRLYRQDRIMILTPKKEENQEVFNFIKEKLPYATIIEDIACLLG